MIRHTYVTHTKVSCTNVTASWHVNRDVRVAYDESELRIYGVPTTLLSYVPRMCDVCTAYGTCNVRATNVLMHM